MAERHASLLAVIEPIVHGQIRDFRRHHPGALANGLAFSLAKRIINDLTRGSNSARLRAAALVTTTEALAGPPHDAGCAERGRDGHQPLSRSRRPKLVIHKSWRASKKGGLVLARARGWCWVLPPKGRKPLTYATESLTPVETALAGGGP